MDAEEVFVFKMSPASCAQTLLSCLVVVTFSSRVCFIFLSKNGMEQVSWLGSKGKAPTYDYDFGELPGIFSLDSEKLKLNPSH